MFKFMMKIRNDCKIFITCIIFIWDSIICSPITANETTDMNSHNEDLVGKLSPKNEFDPLTSTKRCSESSDKCIKAYRQSSKTLTLYKRSKILATDTDKEPLHIFQIRPGYLKKHKKLRNIDENHLNPNFLIIKRPLLHYKMNPFKHFISSLPERRGLYFDPFFPTYHRRSRFHEYENDNYRPYFQRIRNDLPFQNNYMENVNEAISENQVLFTDSKETQPVYKEISVDNIHILSSLSTEMAYNTKRPHVLRSMFIEENATISTAEVTTLIPIDNSSDFPSKNNGVENGIMPIVENDSHDLEFTSGIFPFQLKTISTEKAGHNSSVKKQLTYPDVQDTSSREKLFEVFDKDSLAYRIQDENGTNVAPSNKTKQLELFQDNFMNEKIKVIGTSRVFYENGVPPNLNLSWYLYLNCSREQCQFTNSSNETELLNEGWILHNCTTQGCKEIYPQTESLQKFIGLLLLVFSICILKIIVFLMVFYYCRKIKLAKNGVNGKDDISWDEKESDFTLAGDKLKNRASKRETKRKTKRELSGDVRFEIGETEDESNNFVNNLVNNHENKVVTNRGDNVVPLLEANKINSKIWVPPIQGVSQCLISPKKSASIPIPNNFVEKISNKHSSAIVSKLNKKNHSGIPKLVKKSRSAGNSHLKKEDKKTESPSKFGNHATESNEKDLLLMCLDDDVSLNSNTKMTEDWEAELDDDYKSLIFDK